MISVRWGVCALTLLLGFSLTLPVDAHATRAVASGQQIKKKVRQVAKITSKKRVASSVRSSRSGASLAVVPVFRPPKAPAQRHYAVDGSTFYANGVRVRAAGLEALSMSSASGIGKQQLQQMLDSGKVSIEPLGTDGGDVTIARVLIDGRDVSEMAGMR